MSVAASPFNSSFTSPEPFSLLAEDGGAIGQILRGFSGAIFPGNGKELLREAARRESQGDDPWEFLLGVPNIAPQDAQVFKAAQSQRTAWRRLLDTAHGWGNLRERCEQLTNRRPGTPVQPCERQLFSRMWRVRRWALLDDPELDNEMRLVLDQMGREEEKKLRKRFGRARTEQPSSQGLDANKRDYVLSRFWVRCGKGGPGFMFFSSSAMTHYIHEMLCSPGLWPNHVEKVKKARQRLKLVLADEDNPFITSVRFEHAQSKIVGAGRRGFEYHGEVFWQNKKVFPR